MDLLTLFHEIHPASADTNESYPTGGIQDNPYQLFKGFSSVLLNFASACCILFMFIGIPGNLITIIALARCKKIRNATAVFIINLSCSDLLFCCFNLPLAASTFYHKEWIHGNLMCRLFPLFRYGLLAVSLFTILTITINRYIMIGHPRIYPRIYRRKNIFFMVAGTWLFSFGCLITTWIGKWGRFGLDVNIGSCSILPASNGSSPKEFLFVMAFALPCCAIVLCYARIFYIVRKTALRIHETQLKSNGSVRLNQDGAKNRNTEQLMKIALNDNNVERESSSFESKGSLKSINNEQRARKFLSKTKLEDLKFIDTSVESDTHPISVENSAEGQKFSIDQKMLSSPSFPSTTTPTLDSTTIIQLNAINRINQNELIHSDASDSATDNSLGARANNQPSLTSEIELSSNKEETSQNQPKPKSSKIKSDSKIKQRKLKDESPPKESQLHARKSLANTSGASILYAGRMSGKDRRLLKMILVIFISFMACYLPITLSKVLQSISGINFIFIISYVLVYCTTWVNPIIYVVMSSEFRQAYKNLLMCREGSKVSKGGKHRESNRRKK